MQHELKILPQYFKAVQSGEKTFEIRKNDRGFKIGDTLLLQEIHKSPLGKSPYANYTGQEITKEVTYILEGGQYGLEEGYCILGLKQESIKLQNIDLTGISKLDQFEKVNEEKQELIEAVKQYLFKETEENKNNAISEYFDLIQSALGLLDKFGISADEAMKEYPKHLEKIKLRPRQKKCSKCINCKYDANMRFYNCNKNNEIIHDEYAPTCKSYKEQN